MEGPSAKRARSETTSTEGVPNMLRASEWCNTTFSALLQDPSTHDVTFKTSDGGSVSAHRAIVAAGSPVFHAMLYGNTKEKNENEISLPVVDSYTLQQMLTFIYTGQVQTSCDDCLNLLHAAHYFDVSLLEIKCTEMIAASLDMHNYSKLATIASQQQFDFLHKQCLQFLETNISKIINFEEFNTLPADYMLQVCNSSELYIKELDLFLGITKWYNHQQYDLPQNIARDIFKVIRYPLIFASDLLEKVGPMNMADADLYRAALAYRLNLDGYNGPPIQLQPRKYFITFRSDNDDVEIQQTAKGTVITKLRNTGEILTIAGTIYLPMQFKLLTSNCDGDRESISINIADGNKNSETLNVNTLPMKKEVLCVVSAACSTDHTRYVANIGGTRLSFTSYQPQQAESEVPCVIALNINMKQINNQVQVTLM
ncbi:BTB/POZ domain-containing protein 9-like isoform X3 [Dysidea avara]|uniref:BTB/POZ domain-containing protein 9-like isoform X3 n=1 Tax=Dysidea avara TaxID=196820 RepID=UPI00333002D0